jgi:hypothetical protein
MSEKKSKDLDKIEGLKAETQEQTPETPDPFERVEVFIPRGGERGDPNLTVGLNGVNYVIPRGKKSMVPRCVAEEIQRSEKAKDKYDATSAELLEKAKQ